ncbi:PP2C family protein-serine/threonine phosphatase [Paracoccus luteus]|uniref:PP2C family protein-serine/threonine phosphatase n=1 Tax=Paracoccus luteus TaxID=2508543 RepID=UPI00106FDCFF|nr:fused response regulator/phosphatase [Paracoccus luteus]
MSQTNRLAPAAASAPGRPAAARRLVLLVDDSRAHRRLLSVLLARAGYDVIQADGPAHALDICRARRPDLIVSDWVMRGMSGPDLCRAHRAIERPGYGYFVLLTSKTDSADIAVGLQSGADDFLTKPVSGAELLARLAAGERVIEMQERVEAMNQALQTTLAELRQAQEVMTGDLREARKLQQGLVRERQRRFGPMRASLLWRPAGLIGGDLVGFRQLDDDTVALHAVDVSGHGVTAALFTARLAAQLDGLDNPERRAIPPPAEVVRSLNAMILDHLRTDAYLTMVYAQLQLSTGTVRLIQAGHPHPLLQRASGAIERIGQGGMPVGLFEDAQFDELTLTLAPGDRLFIASDGITEAVSARGQQLGEEGLRAILQLNAPLTGEALLESLCWSVSEFSGGQRSDDVSAILVEHLSGAQLIALAHEEDGVG